MIEHLKTKRFKICFKIFEDNKLKKKFIVFEGKNETEIKSLISIKHGDMDYYESELNENHIKPGIIYIHQVNEIQDGDITRD